MIALLWLIVLALMCAVYYLGVWVGEDRGRRELTALTVQNEKLETMLDFLKSENEHARKLLSVGAQQAHMRIVRR